MGATWKEIPKFGRTYRSVRNPWFLGIVRVYILLSTQDGLLALCLSCPANTHMNSHRLLSLSFEKIPVHFISEQLAKCGTLYLAYRAIEAAERSNKSGVASGFRELKKRRKSIISLAGTYPQLQIELEAAKERSRKDEGELLSPSPIPHD